MDMQELAWWHAQAVEIAKAMNAKPPSPSR